MEHEERFCDRFTKNNNLISAAVSVKRNDGFTCQSVPTATMNCMLSQRNCLACLLHIHHSCSRVPLRPRYATTCPYMHPRHRAPGEDSDFTAAVQSNSASNDVVG